MAVLAAVCLLAAAVLTEGAIALQIKPSKYDGLRVIGAGLPRTGTESLAAALEILGYRTAKGGDVGAGPNPQAVRKMWLDVVDVEGEDVGGVVEWLRRGGYNATTDDPYERAYQILLTKVNPEAKVVLSVHPKGAVEWLRSTKELRRNMVKHAFGGHAAFVNKKRKEATPIPGCRFMIWEEFTDEEIQPCVEAYESWTKKVQEEVPSEQLLVFSVAQGWAPLCAFLGVPVPDGPFPHEDGWGDENWSGSKRALAGFIKAVSKPVFQLRGRGLAPSRWSLMNN